MNYPCENCGSVDTCYQLFSGGKEYYCMDCEYIGSYPLIDNLAPEQIAKLPRAILLQNPDGHVAIRAQMDQELERLRNEGK